MNNPICLTTEDVEKFCERMKGCEEGIKFMKEIHNEIKNDIKEILNQVRKTNGRVSHLEVWRGVITGGLAVIIFILGVIGADLFHIFMAMPK